jgi:hypothetical protein
MSDVAERDADTREAFGTWLLKQDKRDGIVGELARAAKADRRFPKKGTPEQVHAHLQAAQADGNTWAALEDAEMDWTCL